jgi:glycerol-3-phosphate acyltransferase PlsY
VNGITAALLGYLLGSIPFGLLLTAAAGLGDIRAIGSGNIGATNVLRTGRRDLAAATLLFDGGKGVVAVLLGGPIAGLFAVLGHCLSPWLKFRGGKGVATGLGALIGIAWPLGAAACAAWLAALAVTRISSAGALAAFAVAPVAAMLLHPYPIEVPLIAVWVIARHHANVARLRAGTEPRVGRK